MWYEWVFDGIGSTLISLLLGGVIGYITGVKWTKSQYQKAKDNVIQIQKDTSECGKGNPRKKVKNSVAQTQVAGDNATQIQIGGIKSGK